mmetsp:Transcript_17678/g.36683  ORF Transcript_17678/g.36683 Transcript_17678/m.36683 type:complete len:293 (-) Transcript_17678:39-917(-)
MPMLTFQQTRSDAAADEAEQQTRSPEHKRLLSERGENDTTTISTREPTKRRKLSESLPSELVTTANNNHNNNNNKSKNVGAPNYQKETINGVTMRSKSSSSSSSDNNKKVDPTELASAFALASLASLSPGGSSVGSAASSLSCGGVRTPPRESREANTVRKESDDSKIDDEVRKAASFESETRSPKASEHPPSPEQQSQRQQQEDDDRAPSSVISSPTGGGSGVNRRVSFAPNTKEAEQSKNSPSTPTASSSSNISTEEVAATPTARRALAMPQQSPRDNNNGNSNSNNSSG